MSTQETIGNASVRYERSFDVPTKRLSHPDPRATSEFRLGDFANVERGLLAWLWICVRRARMVPRHWTGLIIGTTGDGFRVADGANAQILLRMPRNTERPGEVLP